MPGCGKYFHGFPYTDNINGYRLIPITNENREEVYSEFKARGYDHESYSTLRDKLVSSFLANSKSTEVKLGFIKEEMEVLSSSEFKEVESIKQNEVSSSNNLIEIDSVLQSEHQQTWFEYIFSNILGGVDYFFNLFDIHQ